MNRKNYLVFVKVPIQEKNASRLGDELVFNQQTKSQIAWIEEKSRLDYQVVEQLRKQSAFYGKKITGYLKVGRIYIPEKSVLKPSDFYEEISRIGKRRLSNRQVAIMCFINNNVLKPANCKVVAVQWGSISPSAIYIHYCKFSNYIMHMDRISEKIKRSLAEDIKALQSMPGIELNANRLEDILKKFKFYL